MGPSRARREVRQLRSYWRLNTLKSIKFRWIYWLGAEELCFSMVLYKRLAYSVLAMPQPWAVSGHWLSFVRRWRRWEVSHGCRRLLNETLYWTLCSQILAYLLLFNIRISRYRESPPWQVLDGDIKRLFYSRILSVKGRVLIAHCALLIAYLPTMMMMRKDDRRWPTTRVRTVSSLLFVPGLAANLDLKPSNSDVQNQTKFKYCARWHYKWNARC